MNYKLKFLSQLALIVGVLFLSACDELAGLDPIIASFSADPSSISAGEETTLSWNIVGGETDAKAMLTPGDVEVEKIGSLAVTPSETTTYTLSMGTSTKSLEIVVNGTGDADTGNDDGTDDGGDTGADDGLDGEDTGSADGADTGEDTGADGTDTGADTGGADGTDGSEDGGTDDGTDGGDVSCNGETVDIPDPVLKEALQNELGSKTITCDGLATISQVTFGNPAESTGAEIADLTGLEYAVNLLTITLESTSQDLDLAPLTGLEKLSNLNLAYSRPSDLSQVADIPNLKSFGATNFLDGDFSTLEPANLRSVYITGFSEGPVGVNTVDLADFSEFTNLNLFRIENVYVENSQLLAEFTNLDALFYEIAFEPGENPVEENVAAISNLTDLINLTYSVKEAPPVSVTDSPETVDFSAWNVFTNLTQLKIESNDYFNLENIAFTANFSELDFLTLRNLGLTDITPLLGLPWDLPVESFADLTGNPDIPQEQIEALREKVGVITEE